mgnify:CR=1 FL=1
MQHNKIRNSLTALRLVVVVIGSVASGALVDAFAGNVSSEKAFDASKYATYSEERSKYLIPTSVGRSRDGGRSTERAEGHVPDDIYRAALSDPEFAEADRRMAFAYRQLMNSMTDVGRKSLRSLQLEWLKSRDVAVAAAPTRTQALKILISMTSTRFAALESSLQDNRCKPNLIGFDICEAAKRAAREVAKDLPTQLNKNMSIESVVAAGPNLLLKIRLHYERDYLSEIYRQNGLNEEAVDAYAKKAMSRSFESICLSKELNAFVNLGGGVDAKYEFLDGEYYHTTSVRSCDLTPRS